MKYWLAVILVLYVFNTYAQTVSWDDPQSDLVVFLQIDEEDYKDHPHRKSKKFDVVESDLKHQKEILHIIDKTLRKYPIEVINENFDKLYVYDQFDKGNDLMGTYIGRHGFFFAVPYLDNGLIDSLDFERLLHHEFSHRITLFNIKKLDYKNWKINNQLKYGEIKSYNRDFNPELYNKGFLYKYAVLNKWEDLASFCENIFI